MVKILEALEKVLNAVMASFLLLMGIFVFGNVVLRYFFNSSLPWAEELSRFLLVWITFLGAIGALKDNQHLGFSTIIKRMPLPVKKLFVAISNGVILYLLFLLILGSFDMTMLGITTTASTVDMPLAFLFGVGLISFPCMFVIIAIKTYKAIFVEGAIDQLINLHATEKVDLDELPKEMK